MPSTKHFLLFLSVSLWAATPDAPRALENCRKTNCPDLPVLLNNLGALYYSQGQLRQAQPLLEEAARQPVPLPVALANLAAVYRAQSRYAEAMPLFERAILSLEANSPQGDELPRVLARAAMVAMDLNKTQHAEAMARHALELLESCGRSDSADAALAHNVMGYVFESQNRLPEALLQLGTALQLRVRWLGATHPLLGETLNLRGLVFRHQGSLAEAEQDFRRAVEILRPHPASAELGAVLSNLGNTLAARGELREAESSLREGVTILEMVEGHEHPKVAAATTNLANVLRLRHHLGEAEQLVKKATGINARVLPPGDLRIALDLSNLAVFEADRKHFAEAERLLRQSLALVQNAAGPDDAETGRILANLADVVLKQRRTEEAEGLYKHALSILTRTWRPDDPRLLPWLDTYAALLRKRQEYAEAARLDAQSMRIRVRSSLDHASSFQSR